MLDIVCYPAPSLRETSVPVTEITDELRALTEAMIETMYANKGVGLAAPQIGRNIRLIVVDFDPEHGDPRVLINPEIVSKSKEKETDSEGCLSLPGLTAKVTRPKGCVLRAQTLEGDEIEVDAPGGLLARAFQHEIDHLDGILFIDKASMASKLSLRKELAAMEAEYAG